ncbi:glycosyltransferase family 4 protein [Akkermansiaceae bacterium]|nr:glycosyltransferase family 4 protein [Akkermansiaceae bacterium]
MQDVLIHSPFPRETTQGNTITADRLESVLVKNGISVAMSVVHYSGQSARCLVALNAWRSAADVAEYRAVNPDGKVIVIITGSDINHEELADADSPTRRTMASADALVMLHKQEFHKLTDELQAKCHVIHPSVTLADDVVHETPHREEFVAIIAGNLRPVKNPSLAVAACRKLPLTSRVSVSAYGSASGDIETVVSKASDELANYQWHGMVSHEELLPKMQGADILLNVSIGEGGANAICEAMTMGLPVIATDIGGNKGMLGEDYLGCFPSEDAEALAVLLKKVSNDPVFYQTLKSQVTERAELFTYKVESQLWIDLVQRILS